MNSIACALTIALSLALIACGAPPKGPSPALMRAFGQAGLAATAGRLDQAAALYDQATRVSPTAVEAWLAAAEVYALLDRWVEARARAEQARRLEGETPRVVQALGAALRRLDAEEEAVALYERAIQTHPDDPLAWEALGALALKREAWEEAARIFARLTQITPHQATYWLQRAEVDLQRYQLLSAAEAFERALNLDPDYHALNHRVLAIGLQMGDLTMARRAMHRLQPNPLIADLTLAGLLLKRGDPLEAYNALEAHLNDWPEHHSARLNQARVLARIGQDEEAIALLAEIPKGAPQRAQAQRLIVELQLRGGEVEDALALIERARARRDGLDWARLHAQALMASGRLEAAEGVIEAGLERWPTRADFHLLRAQLAQRHGDQASALERMHAVLEIHPNHPQALSYISGIWVEAGVNLDEAERMIRAALRQAPEDPAINDTLGRLLFRQRRLKEAAEVLRFALSHAPGEVNIIAHLAEVLWASGQGDEARRYLSRALHLADDQETRRAIEARLKRLTP